MQQMVEVRKEAVTLCITCPLCYKLFRDATTITECLHTFCRKCIYKKLSDEKSECCPICNIELGCVSLEKLRPDHNLQHVREKIFPQERIMVKAPEEVTPVALPAKRKEIYLSSLVASNELDGDALPLPQISTSYLKEKYHQLGLGGDKTKSAPAPISPLPSKVRKKDFSSSKCRKKYNFLPKDGKKDPTLSLSKKRSVPASTENAAGKKGKPSLNRKSGSATVPKPLCSASTPPTTMARPGLGGSLNSLSETTGFTNMTPLECLEYMQRSMSTPFDREQVRSQPLLERRSLMCQHFLRGLAYLSYDLRSENEDTSAQMLRQEQEMSELQNLSVRHTSQIQRAYQTIQELREQVQVQKGIRQSCNQEKSKLKATISSLITQVKDLQAELERVKHASDHRADEALREGRSAGIKDGIRRFFATTPGQSLLKLLKESITEGYSRSSELYHLLEPEIRHFIVEGYIEGLRYGMTLEKNAKPDPTKMVASTTDPARWSGTDTEAADFPWWEDCLRALLSSFLQNLEVDVSLPLAEADDIFVPIPEDLTNMRHLTPPSSSTGAPDSDNVPL